MDATISVPKCWWCLTNEGATRGFDGLYTWMCDECVLTHIITEVDETVKEEIENGLGSTTTLQDQPHGN